MIYYLIFFFFLHRKGLAMLLIFSILTSLRPCSLNKPQWEYFEKLITPYACTGIVDWSYDIKNINLRVLIVASRIVLCPWNEVDQSESWYQLKVEFFKEIILLLRSVDQRTDSFKCLNGSFGIAIKRFLCSKPEDVEILSNIFIKHSKGDFCFHKERRIPHRFYARPHFTWKGWTYVKRIYIVLYKIGVCPEEYKVIREKRQFDTLSSLMLWSDVLKFRNKYPRNSGKGDILRQSVYIGGKHL